MAADPVSVRLLGHVSAHRGGRRVAVTGAQRLGMLSMLALRAGECVSSVELIDGIWDEEAPDQARHALHVYISELRKALGADAIETQRGGYRLCVDEEQVDALLFEQMVGRVNGGSSEQTRAELLEALALWRGPALDGAADSATLRAVAARLEEERLAALERRFAAELDLGHHDQILGELTSLVSALPLRESLRSQLMLALYRSGRQAEALAAYREGHAQLGELGLEPGSELRNLERAILRQDSTLAGEATRNADPLSSANCLDDQTLQETLAFAESWASDLRNFDPAAFAAVADRAEQLASAFEHAIGTGAKEAAVRLITATWFYWVIRGRQREADAWADAILALPGDLTPAWEMEGQIAASELARVSGDFHRAVGLKKLARRTAEDELATDIVAGLDADLAHLSIRLGELDLAEAYAQRALELRRSNPNDLCGVGHALVAVGEVHEARGDLVDAVAAYEDAVTDQEAAGFGGEAAFIRGRMLGRAHRACGNTRAAYGAYRRALNEAQPLGDYGTAAAALQGLAWVATVQGDQRGAVRLLAEASRSEWQSALDSHERAAFAEDVAALRRAVPKAVFEAAWRIGTARAEP
ncbi:MAG: BTAD domain-containing putative transcriptional regulator [Gaiellaceae bacterium]